MDRIVIIGAGQAGVQTAFSLRDEGFTGTITLVGEEPNLPYHRPPLSKGLLLGTSAEADLMLRAPAQYEQAAISLRLGQRATAVDRAGRHVMLADGETLLYDHLILATGSRHRRLEAPGVQLGGVLYLRSLEEAHQLADRLRHARRMVIVGAGFVGLEVAAAGCAAGLEVTVVESASRPMVRSVSTKMASALVTHHRSQGVRFLFDMAVAGFIGEKAELTGIKLSDGSVVPADIALIGIGAEPAVEIAQTADIGTERGVVVDQMLLTADQAISAVGDCAIHPNPFAPTSNFRLESVQNATAQARYVAARLTGKHGTYHSLPWFWSDQGRMKLQIAGISGGQDSVCIRGTVEALSFSVFRFRNGMLAAVESLNRAVEHVVSRRLVSAQRKFDPALLTDEGVPLNTILEGG